MQEGVIGYARERFTKYRLSVSLRVLRPLASWRGRTSSIGVLQRRAHVRENRELEMRRDAAIMHRARSGDGGVHFVLSSLDFYFARDELGEEVVAGFCKLLVFEVMLIV